MKQIYVAAVLSLATIVAARGEIDVEVHPSAPPSRPGISVPKPTGSPTAKPDAPTAQDGDAVKFKNADALHGTLLGITKDIGLRWRHPSAKDNITFTLQNVAEIQLAPRGDRPATPSTSVVKLTNDDEMRGDILSLDKDNLVLDTAYAGRVTIKRAMLQGITPSVAHVSTVFSGPTGLEGWIRPANQPGWTYKKGALVCAGNGAIGRSVKLPDMARIEFDMAWRQYPYVQFIFYSDAEGEDFYSGGGYMLQFGGTTVYLQRGRARQGFNNLGSPLNIDNLQHKQKSRVAVLVNKPKKTIALMMDGEMVKQWTDPDDFAGKGTTIFFYATSGQPVKISKINISEWDGKLDTDEGGISPKKEDLVRFVNNDKVSGKLESIANKELRFTTSYATLTIPLERVGEIAFAGEDRERSRRQADDIRAFFADGGRVTVALDKLDEKGFAGSSENFGRLNFALDAFQRLQFHIYDESAEPAGGDEEDF